MSLDSEFAFQFRLVLYLSKKHTLRLIEPLVNAVDLVRQLQLPLELRYFGGLGGRR